MFLVALDVVRLTQASLLPLVVVHWYVRVLVETADRNCRSRMLVEKLLTEKLLVELLVGQPLMPLLATPSIT